MSAPISLCMIVRNEEAVLARCLESAAGLYDELVLVDTGSTDGTPELAARAADRVFSFPWRDDFSAARNFAFDQARCPFCLWLDADDVILPPDREALLAVKEQALPAADVVMARYQTLGPDGAPVLSYYRERILRNVPWLRWTGAVHEAVPPRGTIVYTEAAVTHRKEGPGDPDRNLRILEGLRTSGRVFSPREQYYYGRELRDHHRFSEAVPVLEGFLERGQGWVEDQIGACQVLSNCYAALGRRRQAVRALLEALAYDGPRAEVCCGLGALAFQQEDWRSALRWYELALRCGQRASAGGFLRPDCHGYLPAFQIALCWWHLGDPVKAAQWNEQAASFRPGDPSCRQNAAFFAGLAENGPPRA